jgi:hypothetical protein
MIKRCLYNIVRHSCYIPYFIRIWSATWLRSFVLNIKHTDLILNIRASLYSYSFICLPYFSFDTSFFHLLFIDSLLPSISAEWNKNSSFYLCLRLIYLFTVRCLHFLHIHQIITIAAMKTAPPTEPRMIIHVFASARESFDVFLSLTYCASYLDMFFLVDQPMNMAC